MGVGDAGIGWGSPCIAASETGSLIRVACFHIMEFMPKGHKAGLGGDSRASNVFSGQRDPAMSRVGVDMYTCKVDEYCEEKILQDMELN
jgi:hypothetical protein